MASPLSLYKSQVTEYLSAPQRLDQDGDGVVSLEEFLEVCKEDKDIQLSLLCVDNIDM